MWPMLAQDSLKPPETNDPITWLAMAGFMAIVGLLWWQLRTAATERHEQASERAEVATRQDSALAAFRAELTAQRAHDEARTERTHERIDQLAGQVGRLADAA